MCAVKMTFLSSAERSLSRLLTAAISLTAALILGDTGALLFCQFLQEKFFFKIFQFPVYCFFFNLQCLAFPNLETYKTFSSLIKLISTIFKS